MAFVSAISRRTPIIDGRTAVESLIPPEYRQGLRAVPRGYSALNSPYTIGFEASGIQRIDRSEWPDRTEEIERKGVRISDIVKRAGYQIKNQQRTNYCWMFGSVSMLEARNILQGGKHVELSPASAAAPMTNFRNVGGWGSKALPYLAEHGACPARLWPSAAIDKRYYTGANREAAMRFRPGTFVALRTFDELYSCLIQRIPCIHSSMRWRHLVAAFDPVMRSRRSFGVGIPNSWDTTWGDDGWGVLMEDFGFDECIALYDSRPVFYEG